MVNRKNKFLMEARYGGTLVPGDIVLVARMGYVDIGWFIKEGKGTIHYVCFRTMEKRLKNNGIISHKNMIRKPYCKTHYYGNIVRIANPGELFNSNEFEVYLKGTEILKEYKFI